MTTVELVPAAEQQALFAQLDKLAAETAREQWIALENLRVDARHNAEVGPMLVDYPAQPGGSLLMRAFALDIGVATARWAVNWAVPTTDQVAIHDAMLRVAPEYADYGVREAHNYALGESPWLGAPYFWFFKQIAESEGIDPWIIAPDPYELGCDPSTIPTNVPVATSILLRKLIGGGHPLDINDLSPQVARDALELALDFRSQPYEQAVLEGKYDTIVQFARLWRLNAAGGSEHDLPIDALYQAQNPEVNACVEALNRLYDVVPHLRVLFPMQKPEDLERGVREKIANALFALQNYVENDGRIVGDFSFPDGAPIPINESNPLELIESSIQSIMIAYEAMNDPDSLPLFGRGNPDFHHCQFFNCRTGQPFPVSYHGRAERGEDFDPEHEFAGDATSRYRVQLRSEQEIPFANAEQTSDTVCFRLDYDWRGFALDFGALRHNPYTGHMNDLEVRIGRFFGFGNYLRSQYVGATPTLNHVRSLDAVCASEAEFSSFVREQERRLRVRAGGSTDV